MKNWLIRTRSNYLLGPISREKLIELISSGSIVGDDEVCSGNGFWMFVRETDLVKKYIYDGEVQEFNPVSEALNERKFRAGNEGDEDGQDIDDITVIHKTNKN